MQIQHLINKHSAICFQVIFIWLLSQDYISLFCVIASLSKIQWSTFAGECIRSKYLDWHVWFVLKCKKTYIKISKRYPLYLYGEGTFVFARRRYLHICLYFIFKCSTWDTAQCTFPKMGWQIRYAHNWNHFKCHFNLGLHTLTKMNRK